MPFRARRRKHTERVRERQRETESTHARERERERKFRRQRVELWADEEGWRGLITAMERGRSNIRGEKGQASLVGLGHREPRHNTLYCSEMDDCDLISVDWFER